MTTEGDAQASRRSRGAAPLIAAVRHEHQRPRGRLLCRRGLTGPSGLEDLYPENWVELRAWDLGGINYAVYRGDEAILYDAGTLLVRRAVGTRLLGERARDQARHGRCSPTGSPRIAGLAAFADCPIYANSATNADLGSNRAAIEAGTLWDRPAYRL